MRPVVIGDGGANTSNWATTLATSNGQRREDRGISGQGHRGADHGHVRSSIRSSERNLVRVVEVAQRLRAAPAARRSALASAAERRKPAACQRHGRPVPAPGIIALQCGPQLAAKTVR